MIIIVGSNIKESNKAVTACEGIPSASGVERGSSLTCAESVKEYSKQKSDKKETILFLMTIIGNSLNK